MESKVVAGLGEILWDIFPDGKHLGGAPANFAFHISQFGYQGYAVSAVGDDPEGMEIISILDGKNMNHLLERTDWPTGTVRVTLDDNGVPEYVITENVAWDHIPLSATLEGLARRTDAVCFGTLAQRNPVSRRTIHSFLGAMPAGSLKIFDINLRQNYYDLETIESSLRQADILKINDEECTVVSRMMGFDDNEQTLTGIMLDTFSISTMIVTCGAVRSVVVTKDMRSEIPTPRVEVADTVGAGDSFTAAFTASLLAGRAIPDAHRLAVDFSAYVCSQHGAMPPLPGRLRL